MLKFFLYMMLGGGGALCYSTVHLVSICNQCFSYFRKTGSPSHNFFVIKKKTFQNCKPSGFNFYLSKLNNKTFHHMMFTAILKQYKNSKKKKINNDNSLFIFKGLLSITYTSIVIQLYSNVE